MSRTPKSTCCLSTPRCKRCPLRLDTPTAREPHTEFATLAEDILRGGPPALPESVAEALRSLSLARRDRLVVPPEPADAGGHGAASTAARQP